MTAQGTSIVLGGAGEPQSLAPSIGPTRSDVAPHLFDLVHQSLMTYDDQGRPIPRIARALPSIDGGTWTINEDGTMQTVWLLRDDVLWHDGEPLTADEDLPQDGRRRAKGEGECESRDQHEGLAHHRVSSHSGMAR